MQVPVVLWDGEKRLGAFETRNVSREGLCVAVHDQGHAAVGDREVLDVLLYSSRTSGSTQQLRGLVMHRDGETLGLLCTPDIDDASL